MLARDTPTSHHIASTLVIGSLLAPLPLPAIAGIIYVDDAAALGRTAL